ncbi:MAG: excinuclease ABC subunit UvrA [Candidatus Eisenbacteria bacterium]|nr:excinuclease ABC subunit UvrA [Candidatus Eisenbacteria bacterium]
MDRIRLLGARQHNLKNISLEIPRNALTVITGVSGSGKSSLAFDTLYAEGQRRYVESVSTYARQFLDRLPRPELDLLEGLSPAVAIRQVNASRSARSTVGTATELLDYLRLLYARVGVTRCARCGEPVRPDRASETAAAWIESHPGALTHVLFPFRTRGRSAFPEEAEHLVAAGFLRVFVAGAAVALDPPPRIGARKGDVLMVVADRVTAAPQERTRLAEGLAGAFHMGEGRASLALEGGVRSDFHEGFHCARCDLAAEEPTPQMFSFNSPVGACGKCRGFGNTLEFAEDLVVPDPSKSLDQGALDPWAGSWRWRYDHVWRARLKAAGVRTDVPYRDLPAAQRQVALHGDGGKLSGVVGFLTKLQAKAYKAGNRFLVKRYQRAVPCGECCGSRLRAEASRVSVAGATLPELCRRTVGDLAAHFEDLELGGHDARVVHQVLDEARSRLEYLCRVGLEYLTLDRETRTLSGGEAQRIELANALGARLAETLYVLDEPTVGLHPRDTRRLIEVLRGIRERGNTLVVVEHDREVMEAADCVVDLGPGAGEQGGRVLYRGPLAGLLASEDSLTARCLNGRAAVRPSRPRRVPGASRLRLRGVELHNLHGLEVEIPLGVLVAVSGVSGSGKSTLVEDALYPAVAEAVGSPTGAPRCWSGLDGAADLRAVAMLDQSPIGKSSRSNPATYLKAWDPVRALYADQRLSRERGYRPGDFSFNVPGGRCEKCEGEGQVQVEMFIMADVYLPCDACNGLRFKPEMLEVKYRGRSVADVLRLTVDEAVAFFAGAPAVTSRLHLLRQVGLGYLRLGQAAPTLSGGEAQRLKVARELSQGGVETTLYLMDEPTTGLHPADVRVLLEVLDKLVDRGHTVVVIEHHPEVLAHADWVLDLGPEGGDGGGRVVAQGAPEEVAQSADSRTAPFLRAALARGPGGMVAGPGLASRPPVRKNSRGRGSS